MNFSILFKCLHDIDLPFLIDFMGKVKINLKINFYLMHLKFEIIYILKYIINLKSFGFFLLFF